MDEIECLACAHKDEQEKDKDIPKGTTTFVRAVPEEGYELPTRFDFFVRQMEEMQKSQAVPTIELNIG